MEKVFLSDVLKAIKKAYIWNDDISQQILEKEIKQLPSAEKTGEWKTIEDEGYAGGGCWRCTSCEYSYSFGAYFEADEFNYCPNCGAKMKGEV